MHTYIQIHVDIYPYTYLCINVFVYTSWCVPTHINYLYLFSIDRKGGVLVCVGLDMHMQHAHKHAHARTAFTCIQDICVNVCVFVRVWLGGMSGCSAPLSQPACKANKVRLLLLSIDSDREAMPMAPVLRASRRQEGVWNAAPLNPCVIPSCDRRLAPRFLFAISLGGL